MNKLHLTATPRNEGARRLAWWIGERLGGDVDAAARMFGVAPQTVERIVTGEIVPGCELALPIGHATDNFISRRDWRAPVSGTWFDEPAARPSIAELAKAA